MENRELKNTILKTEIKKLMDEFNNRLDTADERTNDPEDRKEENTLKPKKTQEWEIQKRV